MSDVQFDPYDWFNGKDGNTPISAERGPRRWEAALLELANALNETSDSVESLLSSGGIGRANKIQAGTTTERGLVQPALGTVYFDSTLGYPVYGTGDGWVTADGTPVAGVGGGNAPILSIEVVSGGTIGQFNMTWIPPAAADGDDTYKLYETSSPSGVSGATALTGTSTTRTPGTARTYTYWITCSVDGVESAASNSVTVSLPYVAPGGGGTIGADSIYRTTFEEISYEIASTAENSTKNWTSSYGYIEDIGDGRGYTAGIVGFTSATGDMYDLIVAYNALNPGNNLSSYTSALNTLKNEGEGPTAGSRANTLLGATFKSRWATNATNDPLFRQAQRAQRELQYWRPAFNQAVADGVGPLGLAILYDISVNHGPGEDSESFGGIVAAARGAANPPSLGGSESTYITKLIDKREDVLEDWGDNPPDGRVAAHRALLTTGNLTLAAPFSWSMYGDPFTISTRPSLPAEAERPGAVQPGAPTVSGTPASLLKIGAGGGYWNLGIGYSSGHVDYSQATLLGSAPGGTAFPPYFNLNSGGDAVQFRINTNGGTTSANTHYPRSELREYKSDGTTKAAWTVGSGSHIMQYDARVLHLPPNKPWTTVGQIHDASSDALSIKWKGSSTSSLDVVASIYDTDHGTKLLTGYNTASNTWVTIKIELVSGTIKIYCNGVLKITSTAYSGKGAGGYFKLGNYLQTADDWGGFESPSEYGLVEIRNVTVSHSPSL